MFIDTNRKQKQAPLGAECAHISLLTELEISFSIPSINIPSLRDYLFRLFVQSPGQVIR